MNSNESELLTYLDNKNYQEAVDLVFKKKDSVKNYRLKFLSLIGKENLLDLFIERDNYLNNLSSKKKNKSYLKFPILANFPEEFNLLEDMVIEQALNKVKIASLNQLMNKAEKSLSDGIYPFSDKPSPFKKAKKKTYDTVINFINIKNQEWNGVERRLKPR